MSDLDRRDPDVVTEEDLRYEVFDHCGDEELYALQCPECEEVFVFCAGCDSVIPDLTHPRSVEGAHRTRDGRFACPRCSEPFAARDFLDDGAREDYEISRQEFVRRGFGRLLISQTGNDQSD
ncbi:MAG: hypothetical protein NVS4B3_17360 [Gemmatimonadaceae bacterium]